MEAARLELLEEMGQKLRLTNEVVSLIVTDRNTTCSQAVEELDKWLATISLSARTHSNTVMILRKWLKDSGLRDQSIGSITEADINGYVNDTSTPIKRGTRALRLAAIRKLFSWCLTKRMILSDPSRLVRVNHRMLSHAQLEAKHKNTFTESEIEYMLVKSVDAEPGYMTPGFFRAAIILGRDLALRLGDICNLEWASFDMTKGVATVWTAKGGSRVEIPLTNRVIDTLLSLKSSSDTHLFPNERAIIGDVNRRAGISVAFGRFLKSIGLEGYSFHSLRATYATTMANAGASLADIAKALGHAGTDVTKVYVRDPDAAKVEMR
jgi:integrase